MGYVLQIPPVPLSHVRPMGPQFPPHLFVPAGVQVSFEGGLSLDDDEEAETVTSSLQFRFRAYKGHLSLLPSPLSTNPTKALPTASPVGPWGTHGKDPEM